MGRRESGLLSGEEGGVSIGAAMSGDGKRFCPGENEG